MVGFYDRDMRFPSVQTLVYVGRERGTNGTGGGWLFKEPSEALEPPGQADEPTDTPLVVFSADQLYQILDFSGLRRAIEEVAADHPLYPPTLFEPIGQLDLTELSERVHEFLTNRDFAALTIVIRFTDDGVSIGRRDEDGLEMNFFLRSKQEPNHEAAIRTLFEERGWSAHRDYLANKGRTRILQFPVPVDRDTIVQVCAQVLASVYSMRAGDSLRYEFLRNQDVHGAG